MSQGAHQEGAYPVFRSMKRLIYFIKFDSTHLYWRVESDTVIKGFVQEHNTMSPARAPARTARSGIERTNHEPNVPPVSVVHFQNYRGSFYRNH